nr:rhamnan synthesis F family protein [uncultured Desulfobacter sp.]
MTSNDAYQNIKKLNCILPSEYLIDTYANRVLNKRIAVVIHMHYIDSLERYKNYINNIHQEITVYFTTSNEELRKKIEIFAACKDNYRIIPKKNRGRDISSFLVACRKEILNYEYICFLHDKKEKYSSLKPDTDRWIYNMWENMLGSMVYINNLIIYLEKKTQIGLLLPPIHFGERSSFAFRNTWFNNYNNTIELAKRLDLHCDIKKAISPMAIGTVFWAKVKALRKLFEYEWRYEHFDEEPLAEDGTLSHAIERILEFVAKDAGYETKWVMTNQFAEERLENFQEASCKAFDRLQKLLGLRHIYDLDRFDNKVLEMKQLCRNYKKIYIYGAGVHGKKCLLFMYHIDVKVDAFVVTNMIGNGAVIKNISVYSLDEIEVDNDTLIVVAAKKEFTEEILGNIEKKQWPMNAVYNWVSHLD